MRASSPSLRDREETDVYFFPGGGGLDAD